MSSLIFISDSGPRPQIRRDCCLHCCLQMVAVCGFVLTAYKLHAIKKHVLYINKMDQSAEKTRLQERHFFFTIDPTFSSAQFMLVQVSFCIWLIIYCSFHNITKTSKSLDKFIYLIINSQVTFCDNCWCWCCLNICPSVKITCHMVWGFCALHKMLIGYKLPPRISNISLTFAPVWKKQTSETKYALTDQNCVAVVYQKQTAYLSAFLFLNLKWLPAYMLSMLSSEILAATLKQWTLSLVWDCAQVLNGYLLNICSTLFQGLEF